MKPSEVQRLLFIVDERRRPLYDSLRRTFAEDDTVQIVLNRRVADRRRKKPRPRKSERRQKQRRAQREIDRQIDARGYAVVGISVRQRSPGERSTR